MSYKPKPIDINKFIELFNLGYSKCELQRYFNIGECRVNSLIKQLNLYRSKEDTERIRIQSRLRNLDKATMVKHMEQTCMKKYGVSNISKLDDIKQIKIETILNHYGDWNNYKREMIKNVKQTKLDRYGDPNYNNHQKAMETQLNRYGVQGYNNRPKEHQTKKRNKSFNKSKYEMQCFKLLQKIYDLPITTQIKDNRFIFDIKIGNMYIDIHGTYFHNYRPFKECKEHIKEYNMVYEQGGQKQSIANIWRFKDVQRLNYCLENNIPYVRVYISDGNKIIKTYDKNTISTNNINDLITHLNKYYGFNDYRKTI